MIQRQDELDVLRTLLRRNPRGRDCRRRQVGKTTLARMIAADYRGAVSYFDLENPEDLARLGGTDAGASRA